MSILPTRLPRLEGAWLWAFRALWSIALAVSLFSAIGATWFEWRDAPTSTAPVWLSNERINSLGVRIFPPIFTRTWVINKAFSREAASSGIQSGDEIAALSGHPVTRLTSLPMLADMVGGREGETVVLRLRSHDGALHDRALTIRAGNVATWYRGSGLNPKWQFFLRRIGYDVMTLLLLLPSAVLFLRRSHDMIAAAFSLSLCLVSIGSAVEFWTFLHAEAAYNDLIDSSFVLLLMIGCAFPDGRYWPSWTRFSLIAAPLILIPAAAIAADYNQFSVFTAPCFLAVIVILTLRYRRLAPGIERQQFRWVAFGLAAGVIALLLRIPFVLYQYNLDPGPLSPWIDLAGSNLHAFGYALIGAGFGVALLKYRLYDAESLISRSAAVTATTLMLAGLWAACEKGIEEMLPAMVGEREQLLVDIVSAGMAVILITTIHGHIHEWVEKRFQRGVYRLKQKLPEMLEALSARLDTTGLCEQVLSHIVRDVRATKAAILVRGESGFLVAANHQANEADIDAWLETVSDANPSDEDARADAPFRLALPLVDRLTEESAGWLLVGPRPDGTSCNRDERKALAAAAEPVARAIVAIQAREARESRLVAGFNETIATLESRLAAMEMGRVGPG